MVDLIVNYGVDGMEIFNDRLKSLQGQMSDAAFARKVGVAVQTLNKYGNGSVPSLEIASKIASSCEVSLDWLSGLAEQQKPLSASVLMLDEMIRLPQFDVRASAGSGEIAYSEHPINEVTFERRFLRDLGAIPEQCFLMWATGDSMLPTFPDGAMLVVDQSQTQIDDGRIYVFNVRGALLVKRARWRMDGRLDLVSDNIAGNYSIETFETNRFEDLIIVGRVIYFGRSI